MTITHSQIKITPNDLYEKDIIAYLTQEEAVPVCIYRLYAKEDSEHSLHGESLEAKVALAQKEYQDFAFSTLENFDVTRVAIHLKVGKIKKGEISSIIGVTANDQQTAVEACKYIMRFVDDTDSKWRADLLSLDDMDFSIN